MNNTIIIIIFCLLFVLLIGFLGIKLWRKGRGKEEKNGQEEDLRLEEQLDRNQYKVIKKISLPVENEIVAVGPVIVSTYGIFLIDRLRYGGQIQPNSESPTWRSIKRLRKKNFPDPLNKNYQYVRTLQEKLEVEFNKFRSVIVFDDKSEFKTGAPPNVITESKLVDYIQSYKYQIFQEKEVRTIEKNLRTLPIFTTFAKPSVETVESTENLPKDLSKHVRIALEKESLQTAPPTFFQRISRSALPKIMISIVVIVGLALMFPMMVKKYKDEVGESAGTSVSGQKKSSGFFGLFAPAERSETMKRRAAQAVEDSNRKIFTPDGKGHLFAPAEQGKNRKNQNRPQTLQDFSGIPGGVRIKGVQSDDKNKQQQVIYSWKNEKGERVYSTKGFPSDGRRFSDAQIEWH